MLSMGSLSVSSAIYGRYFFLGGSTGSARLLLVSFSGPLGHPWTAVKLLVVVF